MAPVAQLMELAKRQYYGSCPAGYYRRGARCYRRSNSNWSNWGRWVTLVLIVLFFVFFFFILSCINARRRRKRGLNPYRGTGWTATAVPFGKKFGNNNNNNNQNSYAMNNNNPNSNYATTGVVGAEPVPPYSPPHNAPNNNYNQAQGYYGGQESGIQQPQSAYHPGTGGGQYAPPPGPPPGKGTYGADGVIR